MAVRFCVLASGSSGNAAFLDYEGFGVLVDIGLGPRLIATRLATIGKSWNDVHAALLTHTHTDHWKDRTLAQLRALKIPLYCHPRHHEVMGYFGRSFEPLRKAGLLHDYQDGHLFPLRDGLTCLPIQVPHDSDPTFAFRLAGSPGLFGPTWSLGYASDLGMVPPALFTAFLEVQCLALEFNHDEEMERRSGRPRHLIERVLSDRGHLSNRQATEAVCRILEGSETHSLRTLIQLHLSGDCNKPSIALSAAQDGLRELHPKLKIHTAHQDRPTPVVEWK